MNHPPILIVDKDDKPVGSSSMTEAQEKGLYHRIVRIMVEDPAGNILLQKRAASSYTYPNCWDNSAAGHVDAGEDYEDAAKRELFEEIGLRDVELQEIGYYRTQRKYKWRQLNRFNKVYKAFTSHETEFTPEPDEVSEVKWFTKDELRQLVAQKPDQITDGIIEIFERFYK